jgi:hypothetical protein
MATKRPRRVKTLREYRFKIEAYSPDTMPLLRLTEYLHELALLFGNTDSVHLVRVEKGSTMPLLLVRKEAEIKIRERLQLVRQKDGPAEAMKAMRQINEKLREDDAKGAIIDPIKRKVLVFPGRDLNKLLRYGPIKQPGILEGIPIRLGGEQPWVPVHLENHPGDVRICWVKRTLAIQIAKHLFTTRIQVEGVGKWIRTRDGEWEMEDFSGETFKTVDTDATLREELEILRNIPAEWKAHPDPYSELIDLRHGTHG